MQGAQAVFALRNVFCFRIEMRRLTSNHPAANFEESNQRIQDNMILTDFGIKRVIENREIVTNWREPDERRTRAKTIGN